MFLPKPASLRQPRDNTRRTRGNSPRRRPVLDQLEARQLLATITTSSVLISPQPVAGTEFTAVVAKFTDSDANADPTKYTATIKWGNGLTTAGTITTDPNGGFDVKGTQTYKTAGAFRVSVSITDTDNDTGTGATTNVVAHAPITGVTGVNVNATRGKALVNVTVAKFHDANPNVLVTSLAATINWGDGHITVGKVVVDPAGGFDVKGSHVYAAAGAFPIKVQIHDGGPAAIKNNYYTPSNLISDGTVAADHTNANLVNPWGLVSSPGGSPWWVAFNGTGTSGILDGFGNPSATLPLVSVPAPQGSADASAPTGVVFNNTTANPNTFVVTNGAQSGASVFIFATEDGTISGWNPTVSLNGSAPSTQAMRAVDNSAAGAIYKGLALMTIPAGAPLAAGEYLFASNFHSGKIDVFDKGFQPVTVPAGAFQDPTLPAGYAPFGIQALNGNLYVTYAKQDADKHDDVAGAGHGFVDVYNPAGYLIQRVGGAGVQTELNSPWGIAQAPANFGKFSNDLLVGNFGDSHVSAFDPNTGAFVGQLWNALGAPLTLTGGFAGSRKGLWGIGFGNGVNSGSTNTLFFASGVNDEEGGLFGSLTVSSLGTGTATSTATVANPPAHAVTNHASVGSHGSTPTTIPSQGSNSMAPWIAINTAKQSTPNAGATALMRLRPAFALESRGMEFLLRHHRHQG